VLWLVKGAVQASPAQMALFSRLYPLNARSSPVPAASSRNRIKRSSASLAAGTVARAADAVRADPAAAGSQLPLVDAAGSMQTKRRYSSSARSASAAASA
jgi:hypothetical protein